MHRTDRILVTSHVAWYSQQAFEDLRVKAVQEAVRVLQGELPRNLINPEVKPRFSLARRDVVPGLAIGADVAILTQITGLNWLNKRNWSDRIWHARSRLA